MKPYVQPIFYWLSAIIGLVLALLTDGAGDLVALALVTAPLVGVTRHFVR